MDNRSFDIVPPQKNEFGQDYRKKRSIDPALVRPVKKWSQSSGIGGHNVPEWVVTMQRNRWTVSSGMSGHNAAEYADDAKGSGSDPEDSTFYVV